VGNPEVSVDCPNRGRERLTVLGGRFARPGRKATIRSRAERLDVCAEGSKRVYGDATGAVADVDDDRARVERI